ncbi:MAG: hypothetical protein AAB014_02860 [Nitrospirota bacterium]|jgi:predicted amidophosphoribosyltransferase
MVKVKEDEAKKRAKTCSVCGKPSEKIICDHCEAKIRGEALERKIKDEKEGRTDTGRR